ncbi:hypothetical protein M569_15108, partial [Genlisea aurea]
MAASTSSDRSDNNLRRLDPSHPKFSDRLLRAVHHRLRLLHRADSVFFVLGATGNVYTVAVSNEVSCTCPDRSAPCKHILFVLIRVLGVPIDDSCLWRRNLRDCQIQRLLNLPTSGEALAGAAARKRFHQVFFKWSGGGSRRKDVAGDGSSSCPICLEVMRTDEEVLACAACRNCLHEDCFLRWRKSCRRGSATCVICRARWRHDGDDQLKYLNLSAFMEEE